MHADQDFAAVLSAAQRGESWACAELWSGYAPMVTGFARARGSREPDDLVSEVFLCLFRGLGGFTGDESAFRGYLFTIARHRLVDEARSAARRPRLSLLSDRYDEVDVRRAPSAEDEAFAGSGADVVALLARLSPEQREVLSLRMIADLSLEQVAAIVGKSPGAVKSLQHRALESLRKHLLTDVDRPRLTHEGARDE